MARRRLPTPYTRVPSWRPRLQLLFAMTLFVSATLLFLVQPMIAKMVLPLLGGTPAVWNTCMVFFQTLLLAGYAYAHSALAQFNTRRHAVFHAGLVLLPLLGLPIALPDYLASPDPEISISPVGLMLHALVWTVALPFFVLSTTGPLLQR